jgi:hypothetical protein
MDPPIVKLFADEGEWSLIALTPEVEAHGSPCIGGGCVPNSRLERKLRHEDKSMAQSCRQQPSRATTCHSSLLVNNVW